MPKEIRYNVPSSADKAEFGDSENFTAHIDGFTVYFQRIREENSGYVFLKYDAEVGYVSKKETDVSPKVAMEHAKGEPGQKIRFAD